jgi:hypothetical protein
VAQFTGEKVDWLYTIGDLFVSLELNDLDPDAFRRNDGKSPPRHYRDIEGQTFKNAVVVDRGSVVQLKIVSRGQFGFGYRIDGGVLVDSAGRARKRRDLIARQVHCLGKQPYTELTEIDRGYQAPPPAVDAAALIQIQDFPTLGIDRSDTEFQVGAMCCNVSSWSIYGYIDNEDDADYGMPLNIGENPAYGPASPVPPSDHPMRQQVTPKGKESITAFGGAPTRLVPSRAVSKPFASARLIREDDPRQAPNYASFVFLVSP